MQHVRKSMFKVLFYLKKNAPKKNGKVAIMRRITIDGKQSQFSTKLEIFPDKSEKATYNRFLMRIYGLAKGVRKRTRFLM